MGVDQIVDHVDDPIDAERGARVRIHERRLIDEIARTLHDGTDGQLRDVQERPVQGQALGRQGPDPRRPDPVRAHHDGHLNAGVLGETVDEAFVAHVPVQLHLDAGLPGPDELAGELVVRLHLELLRPRRARA